MEKRKEELREIFKNVNSGVTALLCPMMDSMVDLEKRLKKYKKQLNDMGDMDQYNMKLYTAVSSQIQKCETQRTNIIKVLVSALRKDGTAEDMDAFSEFVNRYKSGDSA